MFAKVPAVLALLAVALLILRAGELLLVTSQHSLWGDEIVSVENFSSQGLAVCLSDYTIPNNHVLFNAINSVLPGAGSFDPLRARIVSFVAIGLGLLVACFALIRRKAWLVLLAFSIAYLGDDRLLGVHLAARGYGMLAFTAVLVCLLVWQHLETEMQRWPLVALAVSVVVGTLTVPTFLFFGGSVLLALFCLRPSRARFVTGLTVFLVTAGYWAWMYLSNHGLDGPSDGFFEGEFHQLSAPLILIELFSLEGWPAVLRYFAIGFAIMSPWLIPSKGSRRTVALSLWLGILGSLVICLIMKRPLMHTVAHLLIPAGFLIGFGMEAIAERWKVRWRFAPLAIVLAMALATIAAAIRPHDPLHLWPTESWREIATVIDATSGASEETTEVWAPFRGKTMAVYFSDRLRLAAAHDSATFAKGSQVLVASPKTKYAEEQVDEVLVGNADVKVSVRQKAGGYQTVAFSPQEKTRAKVIEAAPKPGTTSGKTFLLELALPEGTKAEHILYLHSSDPIMAKPPTVRAAKAPANGDGQPGTRKLEVVAVGQLWAVKLRPDIDLLQPVKVIFYSRTAGDLPPGFVAWVGRVIPDAATRRLLF